MGGEEYKQYRILLAYDAETEQVTAEVPALGIADYGADVDEALQNVREMIAFHLECLLDEGEEIPEETAAEEGFYIHVRLPARAA